MIAAPQALRVSAPHMVAGVLLSALGRVYDAAPIVKYMRGWTERQVRAYVKSKRWTIDWTGQL